ncbi:hypothetical protein [Andreprevotia chitinilytica]|uniref:hypothetical protein n=1 Tax=Andreprevotia chitinilytica TaxID=396808 RepID=UPI0005530399|nr:hypothetical protein [Andreprevotia chitinilytica]
MKQQQLLWLLRKWPRYTGILGFVGAALLVAAGLIWLQKVKPIEHDLDRREETVDAEAAKLAHPAASGASSLAALAPLRHAGSFTDFLRELAKLSQDHKLIVPQTDYKSSPEGAGHLLRYGVQFPATGSYADLRAFVADIEKIPGVRVETFSVGRTQIAEETLAAQIQLSYLTETP